MDNAKKKDLVREYKEQKTTPGIFAVRCGESVWVGPSKNLDKQQNSIWFQLRMNGHMNKAMQALWNEKGADAFTFEVLEEIAGDNPQMIALLLKERDAAWLEELSAGKAL
ncbi:MAG TPA: GIY-YIG nuclease family protein [Rhizomicrobium sp.]|jgi:hypothetical protein|nr:GIY-YIG nuclease family protein [Rhizomicrobium sp.]